MVADGVPSATSRSAARHAEASTIAAGRARAGSMRSRELRIGSGRSAGSGLAEESAGAEANRRVERNEQGCSGGGPAGLVDCGCGTFHAIGDPLFQVIADRGVEPELGTEVVVERAGRHVCLRREVGDGGGVEPDVFELVLRGGDQPGLGRSWHREAVTHDASVTPCHRDVVSLR